MIGINSIGVYLPQKTEENLDKLNKFSISKRFITDKIGFLKLTRKENTQTSSELAYNAFVDLIRNSDIDDNSIDCICFCTQNGDYITPHTSGIMQHKLGLPGSCAAFDISMSCSGYIYSLGIMKSFMESNGFKKGLIFTADPYSKTLSKEDKNTSLLFGDAASVTLLTDNPSYFIKQSNFITDGQKYDALIREEGQTLTMNGRSILNFCSENVILSIKDCLNKNLISCGSIDSIILHQASKFIVDMLSKQVRDVFPDFQGEIPFSSENIGNTVSSTIPIALQNIVKDKDKKYILLSGFGAGLSIGTTIIEKNDEQY